MINPDRMTETEKTRPCNLKMETFCNMKGLICLWIIIHSSKRRLREKKHWLV